MSLCYNSGTEVIVMLEETSLKARFAGFAGGHFILSLLGYGLYFWIAFSGFVIEFPILPVLTGGLMLLYVLAGFLVARLFHWTRPSRKRAVQAVALPAGIALFFAGASLLMLFGGSAAADWAEHLGKSTDAAAAVAGTGMVALLSTVFWASPSFFLMLLATMAFLENGVLWLLCVLPAAVLPPLLFFLGSILGKRELTSAENVIE